MSQANVDQYVGLDALQRCGRGALDFTSAPVATSSDPPIGFPYGQSDLQLQRRQIIQNRS
jgi:hypothetical protein